jgi:transposase
MAYPMEFRICIAAAYDQCGSSIEVAEEHGCSASWVRRLIQTRTATGSLAPKTPDRASTRKLDEADLVQLRQLIADKPDLTLEELAAALAHKASVPTIWRATEAMGLTLKKRPCMRPSRTGPTSSSSVRTGSRSSRR